MTLGDITLAPAIAASLIAAAVSTLGLLTIWRQRAWAEANSAHFAAFASGVLIASTLTQLMPEAIEHSENAPFFILGGYFGLYVLRVLLSGDQPPSNLPALAAALVPLIGIGIHSFVDGAVYSVSYSVDVLTGSLAAFGLIVHEFAEAVILFTLLQRSGLRAAPAFALAFLGAALTTPAGAILSITYIESLSEPVLGMLVATAAGALFYVGATHLFVHLTQDRPLRTLPAFVLGVGLAIMVVLAGGHDHH